MRLACPFPGAAEIDRGRLHLDRMEIARAVASDLQPTILDPVVGSP